jgi:lactoylglutathione lyase
MKNASRFGLIVRTEKYEECVRFYQDILELEPWYTKPALVCFHLGQGYLMVEGGGDASPTRKGSAQCPHILRFDVQDVGRSAAILEKRGVKVEVREYEWGIVGAFADPDGNPCELKNADDPFFT